MTPSPQSAASLPPLPDLQSAQGTGAGPSGNPDVMASIISGVAPVKMAVDKGLEAVQEIAKSGMIPNADQVLSPLIQAFNSILVMTMQQAMQPAQGARPGAGPFSLSGMPGGGPGAPAANPQPGQGQ